MSDPPLPRVRVVVADDGEVIRLALYEPGAQVITASLALPAAARLVADLSAAVASHMARKRNGRIGVRRGPP